MELLGVGLRGNVPARETELERTWLPWHQHPADFSRRPGGQRGFAARLEEHRRGLVGEGAGFHVRREVNPVELLQRCLTGGKELVLFRWGRTGNRLLEAQPIQYRECLAVGVGVFNGKAS